MKKILVNYLPQEIRVAFLERENLVRVIYERVRNRNPLHNIYKGKVLRVLPGMECAFVDVGLPKASFLGADDVRTDFPHPKDDEGFDLEEERNDKNETQGEKTSKIKIEELLHENSEMLVQVTKGAIGTKGPRISCKVTIPGRNLVLTPYMNSVNVSRQISSTKERARLIKIVSKNRPSHLGFIIRTVAQSRPEEEILGDVKFLVDIWERIQQSYQRMKAPALLYGDLSLTQRILRDNLSQDIEEFVIDSREEYEQVKNYVDKYLPSLSQTPVFYDRKQNIFDHYGVNSEINRALEKKVFLASGGYLIIDQSEALTAIDINTGSFTGDKNHEATILKTNLEAVVELVKQIRIRDIGGIIVIDFIDMELASNRNLVYRELKRELKKDKAKTHILQISEIGLVEMTRKRSHENLDNLLRIPCPHCQGSGKIKSIETTVYDIYRDLFRLINDDYKNILIGVHPDIFDFIEYNEAKVIASLEKEHGLSLSFKSNVHFHQEQYEIFELE